MRPLIAITLICCCCAFSAFSQSNFSVKGTVTDTTSKALLDDATITVLTAKDSLLQKFTYSNKGAFELTNLKPGKYLLLITNDTYADYSAAFTLDDAHPVVTFKNIGMIERSKLLNEVMILGKAAAIKIKGDTTIFNASAFETQKNAKVDDLLKQLPGMNVDQNGKITFQGEQVKRILVDGDEFFSDDPVLVSRTVRADMVARVKVYDDKSETSKLTGIEDGVKIKTINLETRDDKKKGVFGKLQGEIGNSGFYTGQAMFNKFSPKEKISVYGNMSNTGKVGLSGNDNTKFGSGVNGVFFSDGMVSGILSGSGGGSYNGIGIPEAKDAGLHYDAKWNKDKQTINANYKIGALDINNVGSSITRNTLPGNDYNTSISKNTSHNYDFSNNADAIFTTVIDSTSSLNATVRTATSRGDDQSDANTQTLRSNGFLRNTNQRNIDRSDERSNGSLSLNYIKRLKKKGRSISLSGSATHSESKSEEYLKSNLSTYNAQGNFLKDSIIDQYKPANANNNSVGVGFNYTEPLSPALNLIAGYRLMWSNNDNKQLSYNKSGNGYDQLDDRFSNDFSTSTSTNLYNLRLGYSKPKLNINAGLTVTDVDLKQTDNFIAAALKANAVIQRNFINWNPNANFRYQLTRASSVNANYNGYTFQPTINQLQPLRQNSDPLNIQLGNQNLKPEFYSSYGLGYRVYYDSSISGYSFNASYSNTVNAIISNRSTDTAGVNTYQYINLQGNQNSGWRLYFGSYGKVTKFEFSLEPSISVNGSTNYNYVNNQLNRVRSITYSPGARVSKSKQNYSYSFGFNFNYTANASSQQQVNNNTRGFTSNLSLYTKLPFNFYIGTDGSYEFTAKNQVFTDDFHRVLLKANFGKNFLADESLKVSITGYDLFNQNTGYRRSGTADNFTESRNNTIMRYFMLSVSWDFSKFSKPAQTKK
ncbi:TonB-dependent receptor [Mucilaginibacter antarcticus]|uniref:TonB-dependent receptor n=1 Tax=Mucilaginibacter antarcticus TaxID=1855725 RepID=A0ABW5XM49_9SPHI